MFVLFAREARRVCSVHGRARVATVRHSGRSRVAHERHRSVQEAAQEAHVHGEASQTGRAHFESPAEAYRRLRGQRGQASTTGSSQMEHVLRRLRENDSKLQIHINN